MTRAILTINAGSSSIKFAVYALDVPTLGLSGAFTGADVRRAMAGHVLAEAKLLGTYAIHPGAAR